MSQEHPSVAVRDAAVCEAFPSTVAPPWRRRRPILNAWPLLLVLVAAVGIVVAIHIVTSYGGGESAPERAAVDEEIRASFGSPAVGEATGNIDPADIADSQVAWAASGSPGAATASGTAADAQGAAESDGGGEAQIEQQLVDEPEASHPENVVHRGRVGSGNTMSAKLSSHGLSSRQIHDVVAALKGSFDFRDSRPTHRYWLELGRGASDVKRFRYQVGPTEIYEVIRSGAQLEGKRVPVKVVSRRIKVGRRIKGSLSQAVAEAGLKHQVYRAFMKTFGREMSFKNNLKAGDGFRAIVEENRLKGTFVGYEAVWAVEYIPQKGGRKRAYYFRPEGPGTRGRYYDDTGRSFERTKLRTPLNYKRISSPFDLRRMHPVLKRRVPHRGVDFAAKRGTHVWATAPGTVTHVGRKGASGNLVVIRHEGDLDSFYAHLSKFARGLKSGQTVRQGQLIGYVGSTGRSTGPHLHFGLRQGGRFVDPMSYRSGPGRPLDTKYRNQYRHLVRRLKAELRGIRIE